MNSCWPGKLPVRSQPGVSIRSIHDHPERFDGVTVRRGGSVPSGRVHIALGGEPMTAETMRERLDVARAGLVTVVLVLGPGDRLAALPRLAPRGVAGLEEHPRELEKLAHELRRSAREVARRRAGREALVEEARRLVRREVDRLVGSRPVVDVQIVEVP